MSDDGNNLNQEPEKVIIQESGTHDFSLPSEADLWKSRVQSRPGPETDPPENWDESVGQNNSTTNNDQT